MIPPDHAAGPRNGAAGNNLLLRVISAAVLAPLTLAITYIGGPLFVALCALAAAGILWEWTALVSRRGDIRILAPGLIALAVAAALIATGRPGGAFIAVAAGAVVVAVHAAGWLHGGLRQGWLSAALWAAAGMVYAGALLLGPALLRHDPQWGLTALLFLFANVWATDIFAYFCGRAIGGPLLSPRISPKKTWSGAAGGLIGGIAASLAVAYASGVGGLGTGVMAAVLSILAQAGDLLESAVKRRFDAKDAGQLIPGHGGLMDRLDGFLVAALAALLIGMVRQGAAAPARGFLLW